MVRKIDLGEWGVALHLMYRLQAAMTPHFMALHRFREFTALSQPQESRANRFVKGQALASRLPEEPAAMLGYA